jgi:hypothetical protein
MFSSVSFSSARFFQRLVSPAGIINSQLIQLEKLTLVSLLHLIPSPLHANFSFKKHGQKGANAADNLSQTIVFNLLAERT